MTEHGTLVQWRPRNHIALDVRPDAVETYCGIAIPTFAVDEQWERGPIVAPDINWTHRDLCHRCALAYSEAHSPEPVPSEARS